MRTLSDMKSHVTERITRATTTYKNKAIDIAPIILIDEEEEGWGSS
jgi:hypothetical protein